MGAGEFTIHFSPGDRGLHLPSLAKKVNAPLMPEGGGGGGGGGEAGVSNDWCITVINGSLIRNVQHEIV